MVFFKVLWGFDALIVLVILFFFIEGLSDNSVGSSNMGLWMMLVIGSGAILGGSILLKSDQHLFAAKALLLILAIPGFLYMSFVLFMLIARPKFN